MRQKPTKFGYAKARTYVSTYVCIGTYVCMYCVRANTSTTQFFLAYFAIMRFLIIEKRAKKKLKSIEEEIKIMKFGGDIKCCTHFVPLKSSLDEASTFHTLSVEDDVSPHGPSQFVVIIFFSCLSLLSTDMKTLKGDIFKGHFAVQIYFCFIFTSDD